MIFLIFQKNYFFLFADDTNIYYESNDLKSMEKTINEELKNLTLWLNVNRLSLNISKTNFVIFHVYNKPLQYKVTLKMNNKAIMQKKHIKYLGVIVDSHLSWKPHILNVSKKIGRSIGIMYKLREFMDIKMLKNIYYSLIYSHMVYAIQVWGSACNTDLDKILILQKKAVRIMTNNCLFPLLPGPLVSSNPLFKDLEILKVKDIFKLHVAKFIFSCLSFNTPTIFHEWFTLNSTMHNYNTVSNTTINQDNYFDVGVTSVTNKLHIRGCRLVNYGGKLLKVAGPILWNSLPAPIRDSQSINSFKFSLKKFLIDQYIEGVFLKGHIYILRFPLSRLCFFCFFFLNFFVVYFTIP